MISDARGGHVSPGIYTEIKDVNYAAKSIGITSLGLAGETLKGPAFQAIPISDWSEFNDYFGTTSTEVFKGTGYPKYELPYIAKEYLKESKQLYVTRVLGLSGYEAGSALTVSLKDDKNNSTPVVIFRSKGTYSDFSGSSRCEGSDVEKFTPYVTEFKISAYKKKTYNADCSVSAKEDVYPITGLTPTEYGTLKSRPDDSGVTVDGFGVDIVASGISYHYNVSLKQGDSNYIYNIFSTDPKEGSAPVYVEEVFDLAMVEKVKELAKLSATCSYEAIICNESGVTDYKDYFRCAVTPWIVSNVKSATEKENTLKRLFKFYTISDGNASNREVKISIQNIRPDKGLFDVVVRDFYDSDASVVVLEKYANCTMVEGDANYIGLKIGTADGLYEAKSKYVTVLMSDEDGIADCVPAGYLGYPIPKFGATERIKVAYNTAYNNAVKAKRQYFGLNSNILDEDILSYKGIGAYDGAKNDFEPERLTNGFHMDSILSVSSAVTYVDGVSGFSFTTVNPVQDVAAYHSIPRIIQGTYMDDTIYADINTRKFTVYPYGGFDGWDIHREKRTIEGKYKANRYPITGDTCPFKRIGTGSDLDLNLTLNLNLPNDAISSDYYAYLAGYRQFANPNDVDINLFATPGIDWINNELLVEDALDMVEDTDDGRAGDALYIVTTPQTREDIHDDYTANDVADARDSSDIDTCLACTYYPWVKVYDSNEKKYINLPVTKDVVRNMAYTDNNSYPWFAPAGVNRGNVDCTKAYLKTTLSDEDTLYNAQINPIKTFAVDGVKVWGNKTLYTADTPRNRVNVVRLMLRLKKLVNNASKVLLFDQHDATLDKQFRSLVEPILSDVKSNRGISDYKVVTESTAETRDQHILPAKIFVKPIGALEYISITFTVYPEGVDFED